MKLIIISEEDHHGKGQYDQNLEPYPPPKKSVFNLSHVTLPSVNSFNTAG